MHLLSMEVSQHTDELRHNKATNTFTMENARENRPNHWRKSRHRIRNRTPACHWRIPRRHWCAFRATRRQGTARTGKDWESLTAGRGCERFEKYCGSSFEVRFV